MFISAISFISFPQGLLALYVQSLDSVLYLKNNH